MPGLRGEVSGDPERCPPPRDDRPDRLELLRAFVQDWALLRHGDQTAERLRIEREWLGVASRDADMKWKRKIIVGLETLKTYADKHPKARAAMAELSRQVRHPFDPTESD